MAIYERMDMDMKTRSCVYNVASWSRFWTYHYDPSCLAIHVSPISFSVIVGCITCFVHWYKAVIYWRFLKTYWLGQCQICWWFDDVRNSEIYSPPYTLIQTLHITLGGRTVIWQIHLWHDIKYWLQKLLRHYGPRYKVLAYIINTEMEKKH